MDCVACGSAAVTERPEHTARGYRRFRCRDCGKGYNERSAGLLNHAQYPSDVIALVVLSPAPTDGNVEAAVGRRLEFG